ncbi:4Fe-4S binding protein [Gordonibacter massiliensis (ex Traore et al. 2017)]|uniref:4Fe-4S binding protein n=1 Tax=Gordonibacter massiliensis (ex Traore et al. 2017) TaxID=1841863 RepID=UPI001C8BB1DC|nr:4Fe-4S binding protein [Gordonibacter massiliensis (ex Traore et al. 2017)]MBX9033458.1 4Fe-4S binding protein [Gordonibacter massiliensis (ex Traore et al. 2017)]
MPDLIDRALRAAERPPVALLHAPRCLTARDASARCTACADACPVDALAVTPLVAEGAQPYESVNPTGEAGPRIDNEACVRCGACVTACPTNALLPLPPLDDEALFARAASTAAHAAERAAEQALDNAPQDTATWQNREDGAAGENAPVVEGPAPATAGLVCERWAQTRRLDRDRTVVLPCLGWVDAPLLVHMACNGAERIVLPLEACAACALTTAAARVPEAAAQAQRICGNWGLDIVIEATGEDALAPLEANPDADAAGELSRRNLIAQAGTSLVDAAKAEAAKQLESLAGASAHADTSPEPDARRWQLLDDLHAAGLPDDGTVVPRALAPRVSVDVDHCSGCAQCALFCPTEALRKAGRLPGGRTLLEFDPSRCRDCGVCEDTCRYGALVRDETLTVGELFALDPIEIAIPKRRVLPERRQTTVAP